MKNSKKVIMVIMAKLPVKKLEWRITEISADTWKMTMVTKEISMEMKLITYARFLELMKEISV